MSLLSITKKILLSYISMGMLLFAEGEVRYFDVQNGLIEYEILGGAQLTNETNLNIYGKSKLQFKNWGNTRQENDDGLVVTQGAINYVQKIKRVERHSNGKVGQGEITDTLSIILKEFNSFLYIL